MMTDEAAARRAYAATQWTALTDRLRTVTPQSVGRTALSLGAIGGALWLVRATRAAVRAALWLILASWPAFVPFGIGGLLAYALLPVVDALDRVLPRSLAALASVLVAVGGVTRVVLVVVPTVD